MTVRTDKAQRDQMFSGLPPKADFPILELLPSPTLRERRHRGLARRLRSPCIGVRAMRRGAAVAALAASGAAASALAAAWATHSTHSITSSARASSVGGRVRPRALAVLRLMTSWYLVGCCTGRSAGLAP